jgi:hypothetical protein
MKTLLFALLVVACALPLRADNCLQNGDFTDGITHWHGDGRSPADYASDNPLQSSDPFTSKGLIIPLKHVFWTKVQQDFKSKAASVVLSITYKLSPDLAFSEKPDDYVNIPEHLGWGWVSFNAPPKGWLIDITEVDSVHGTHGFIKPALGSSDAQTYQTRMTGLKPLADNTLTLAFPPGTGTVVILNVSITEN